MRDVVIFAKAPVLGTVKTRLAAGIGDAAALAVYRQMLHQVTARLAQGDWRLRLAVTPDVSAKRDDLWPEGVMRVAQGGGDLGARMLRFLAPATMAAPVVVVGSDIPGLGADHVAQAFAALRRAPLVFGPAEDGGFYLVGASKAPSDTLFAGVTWSTASVLQDTITNCAPGDAAQIETLADLDDAASLAAHQAAGRI